MALDLPVGTPVVVTEQFKQAASDDMDSNVFDGTHSSVLRDIMLEAMETNQLYVRAHCEDGYELAARRGGRTYNLPCVAKPSDLR